MPKNISEMEKEIVKSALGMRVKLAATRGYREDDTKDAIAELMLSNPEMFDELRKAAGEASRTIPKWPSGSKDR